MSAGKVGAIADRVLPASGGVPSGDTLERVMKALLISIWLVCLTSGCLADGGCEYDAHFLCSGSRLSSSLSSGATAEHSKADRASL